MTGAFEERSMFGDLVLGLVDVTDGVDELNGPTPLVVSDLTVTTPVELDVRSDGIEPVTVLASPPSQRVETGVMPVWHRLRVSIVRSDGRE